MGIQERWYVGQGLEEQDVLFTVQVLKNLFGLGKYRQQLEQFVRFDCLGMQILGAHLQLACSSAFPPAQSGT